MEAGVAKSLTKDSLLRYFADTGAPKLPGRSILTRQGESIPRENFLVSRVLSGLAPMESQALIRGITRPELNAKARRSGQQDKSFSICGN